MATKINIFVYLFCYCDDNVAYEQCVEFYVSAGSERNTTLNELYSHILQSTILFLQSIIIIQSIFVVFHSSRGIYKICFPDKLEISTHYSQVQITKIRQH